MILVKILIDFLPRHGTHRKYEIVNKNVKHVDTNNRKFKTKQLP